MRLRRRGSSAIEFALTLPILVLLLCSVMEWGWYFMQQMSVMDAVREGTRVGAATAQDDDPAGIASEWVYASLADSTLDATDGAVQAEILGAWPDELLQVTFRMPYPELLGFVPTPGSLGHVMTMRLEDQVEPGE